MTIDRATLQTILTALKSCGQYLMSEDMLFIDINRRAPKRISMDWMRYHLEHAIDKGFIAQTSDALDNSDLYAITDVGKNALNNA